MPDATRRRLLRSAATVTTASTLVSLAGCTGNESEDDTVEEYSLPEASASVEVDMGPDASNLFEPEIVHVETGGTVTWQNVSGRHSATAYAPENDETRRIPEDADAWDSTVLTGEGKSFSHTFETPGVYDYYCSPHEMLGMIGTVVVGDPATGDQPGLTAPSDDRSGEAASKIESLNADVRSALE